MPLTPEQHITAFIHLIEHQPSVILDENRIDLQQKIDKFPEDVASLSDAILDWCMKHPNIYKALNKTRKSLFPSTSGHPRGQDGYIPKSKPEEYKTLLKNQIQVSFKDTKITQDTETTEEKKPSDSNK